MKDALSAFKAAGLFPPPNVHSILSVNLYHGSAIILEDMAGTHVSTTVSLKHHCQLMQRLLEQSRFVFKESKPKYQASWYSCGERCLLSVTSTEMVPAICMKCHATLAMCIATFVFR